MGGHGTNDVGFVALGWHSVARRSTSGLGSGGWVDVAGVQAGGGQIINVGKPDTVWPTAYNFNGTGNEHFVVMAASLSVSNGVVLYSMIDRGFIDFHQVRQWVALGVNHGAEELGGQQPRAFVGADAKLLPKLKCRDAI
jgi:hypothetical protein